MKQPRYTTTPTVLRRLRAILRNLRADCPDCGAASGHWPNCSRYER